MNKKEYRKKIHLVLNELSERQMIEKSSNIQHMLFTSEQWKQSTVVGVTVSRFPEVDTHKIIERAWDEGKKVVVPRCIPQNHHMEFYEIHSFNDVEESFFGLLEPLESLAKISPNDIDLMIVPGLLYSKNGYRIGFGGGYYDRYLAHYSGVTLSLCFDEQLVENVPTDTFDIAVHHIIGEGWLLEII
ncbi:5-formyltetrahydrofolate cyclo-ligase [Jeotgalibacillus marinus]|uniref:5-formyltetrahydrofolate cyclo-ligase n=1 Tax=Jeotgalibacillus marinus TaxID=86667 RepID=A0ABV3PZA7_9BACL